MQPMNKKRALQIAITNTDLEAGKYVLDATLYAQNRNPNLLNAYETYTLQAEAIQVLKAMLTDLENKERG